MESKAKAVKKNKLPISLIIGAFVILLAAVIVFFVGFYPDIKTKKIFCERVETIRTSELTHITVEDPNAPSGIFENAGYSTVIEDSRCKIIKDMFTDAFGEVRFSGSEEMMITDYEYHLRFRIDEETKFDFYLNNGEVYVQNGSFCDSFAPKDPAAYDRLTGYLFGLIIEEGGALYGASETFSEK